ncbi:MAG: toll/interleukin-1 receptor domain-containing protein, partial [Acidobacteria bacterium]|nr:toll/interleukin-1 receptor domain-containing protein [Acidobacteriota bacterium]
PGQRFDEVIEKALLAAKCVVVLWSEESIKSRWVRNEASEGVDRDILLPVFLERVNPPFLFRRIQAADLSDWHGDPAHPELKRLLQTIGEKLRGESKSVQHREPSTQFEVAKQRPLEQAPATPQPAHFTARPRKPAVSQGHITFIHGISNKPAPETLLKNWRQALGRDGGLALSANGISSTMVYWADVLYGDLADSQSAQETLDGTNRSLTTPFEAGWRKDLAGKEKKWVDEFAAKLKLDEGEDADFALPGAGGGRDLQQAAVPWWLMRPLMEVFLRDVHHYLFNAEHSPRAGVLYRIQDEIRARLLKVLEKGATKPGPHVLVSHSVGAVFAYDCLKRVTSCPKVDALITVGSPLGMDAIQKKLTPEYSREDGFPSERLRGAWVNVYDALDPVAGVEARIANLYQYKSKTVIEDIHEPNYGGWRHDIHKYLQGPVLRARLEKLLGL